MDRATEITKNKMKALEKLLDEIQNKINEKPEIKEEIIKYSKNHKVDNITLLRRFANPTKDPDPLASTMVALSYKYPIIMKKEFVSKYPNDFVNTATIKDRIIENPDSVGRIPGWVGCKKRSHRTLDKLFRKT